MEIIELNNKIDSAREQADELIKAKEYRPDNKLNNNLDDASVAKEKRKEITRKSKKNLI